ncbi:NAD-dependent protein lipoamidase sirtuin-4, mitochondrial-like [Saccoglossus kowalevskii]|uniref:NAD-dependent protein deacylase n=1 Tax=Saccoglossus kowalevskii TaxID=10224 RepID=A0ABM0GKT7_SACKO|nr:PREDICTED: NAD-dependent protein deacetylase sirtuin-4-like [Saccoglossus kowalevskii]
MALFKLLCTKKLFRCTLTLPSAFYSSEAVTTSTRLKFVPVSDPAEERQVKQLTDFVNNSQSLFILSGAGISTESGIPDYRSEGVGLYARSDQRPIQYSDFLRYPSRRVKYWARNYVGWPLFSSVQPNLTHKICADWEEAGKVHWLVTQNVDALHTKAGSKNITELHGCSHRVVCLSCQSITPRKELQKIISELNPRFKVESLNISPDGDVLLSDEEIKGFQVPECTNCGGILKPDVVFFGDNVPRPIVHFVFKKLSECDSVLVIGSSLFVYSGYRFILAASEQKKPVAVLNIGETRADHLADLKINAKVSDVLQQVKLR